MSDILATMAAELAQLEVAPDVIHTAGLRTKLVSKATGLSVDKLRYWHKSGLLEASTRAGRRGVARLYSWADYLRLRIAHDLANEGIGTRDIRESVHHLDGVWPAWYMLPDRTHGHRGHVETRLEGSELSFLADRKGQLLLPWPDELVAVGPATERALKRLTEPGADLGQLREYADDIVMHPTVNFAKPTVRGTSLETMFVRGMATDIGGAAAMAEVYRLDVRRVERAIEFEEVVA